MHLALRASPDHDPSQRDRYDHDPQRGLEDVNEDPMEMDYPATREQPTFKQPAPLRRTERPGFGEFGNTPDGIHLRPASERQQAARSADHKRDLLHRAASAKQLQEMAVCSEGPDEDSDGSGKPYYDKGWLLAWINPLTAYFRVGSQNGNKSEKKIGNFVT